MTAVPAKKSKFADEDASDDDNVKDDWDVSDSDEDKPKKVAINPAAVGSMRNKGAVKKKIAEKEEAERRRLEEEEQKVKTVSSVLVPVLCPAPGLPAELISFRRRDRPVITTRMPDELVPGLPRSQQTWILPQLSSVLRRSTVRLPVVNTSNLARDMLTIRSIKPCR